MSHESTKALFQFHLWFPKRKVKASRFRLPPSSITESWTCVEITTTVIRKATTCCRKFCALNKWMHKLKITRIQERASHFFNVVIELGFMQASFCRFSFELPNIVGKFQVSSLWRYRYTRDLLRALCDIESDCDIKQSICSFSRNRSVVYISWEKKQFSSWAKRWLQW